MKLEKITTVCTTFDPKDDTGTTVVTNFITITGYRNDNFLELQLEGNFVFMKELKKKVPAKYRRKGSTFQDKRFSRKIYIMYVHKMFWTRLLKLVPKHFVNGYAYAKGNCYDVINGKRIVGDARRIPELEADIKRDKFKVFRDR